MTNNLSYETAKKLKDAGFPQKGNTYFKNERGEGTLGVYAPSLSELIDALGERFETLDRQGEGWIAYEENPEHSTSLQSKSGRGSTPEEAVANLYLALHNK